MKTPKQYIRNYKEWRERSIYGHLRGKLNAISARQLYEFGDYMKTLEKAIIEEIWRVEDQIDYACRDHKTSVALVYREDQKNIMEGVKKHCEESGFICKTQDYTDIPGYKYLILGW